MTTTFEEEFPILQQLRMEPDNHEAGDMYLDNGGEYIQIIDVQTHCLDKAKVKATLEKYYETYSQEIWKGMKYPQAIIEDLLKELKL